MEFDGRSAGRAVSSMFFAWKVSEMYLTENETGHEVPVLGSIHIRVKLVDNR